jgi:hypothetical protein
LRLTKIFLIDIRNRSVNRKTWFRTLSYFERSLMNLTIRVVDEVRSHRLAGVLNAIVSRLEDALESSFLRKACQNGQVLAEKHMRIACSWGNKAALTWARDRGYILYLGVSSMNAIRMFGSLS